ncbi:MAG: hypothetical protein AAF822_12585 [Pseudomonadota bacterium]
MLLLLTLVPLALIGFVASEINDDDDETNAAADDSVSGADTPETIETGGGDDTVFAAGGNDLVDTGTGDDRAFGQDGNDAIFGGEGDDFLRGSAGEDILFADEGEDTLFGDSGDDILVGADILESEEIFDITAQTNFLPVPLSDFIDLSGEDGEADTLNGGFGDDGIIAGSNDVVSTGDGADVVEIGDWVTPGAPVTITDFDLAEDVIVYDFFGDTPPNVILGELDDGTVTLELDGEIVARLEGLDFQDVQNAGTQIMFTQIS